MKITKPSELREGMKLKGKYMELPISGYAKKGDEGCWFILPHYIVMGDAVFYSPFTDLESVEGLMAMKEGDVLEDSDGNEFMVVFCNEFCFTMVGYDTTLSEHSITRTYAHAEAKGYKLKDQEQPSESPAIITSNELEIQRKVFTEIEDELLKHKFSTDMSGWEIVPQLMATMQILRHKYFKENQGA